MKLDKVAFILISFILVNTIAGGYAETINANQTASFVSDFSKTISVPSTSDDEPILKQFLFGRIKDLTSIEFDLLGNITIFTAIRVRGIIPQRYDGSRAFGLMRYINVEMAFPMKYYQFRGFLSERFICGVFEFNPEFQL